MRPPIASPHGESLPNPPLTKYIEWNAERDCFVLRYRSSFLGRLRGELHLGMRSIHRSPWLIFTMPVALPIVIVFLAFASVAQRFKRPSEFSVFAWGIEYTATEADYRTEWKNISEIFVHNEDFFVELKLSSGSAYCLPRENFAGLAESSHLQNIAKLLREQRGANWDLIVQQFNTNNSHLHTESSPLTNKPKPRNL